MTREHEQVIVEASRLTREIVPYRHAVAALRSWASHTDQPQAAMEVTAILDGYGL